MWRWCLSYRYTKDDLLINPQTYQYSEYQGQQLIDDWRANRSIVLAGLIEPKLCPLNLPTQEGDTLSILHKLCTSLRTDETLVPQLEYWLIVLNKKFEVSKRIYSRYEVQRPHKKSINASFNDIECYLLLAESLMHYWHRESKSHSLSCAIKLCDTLLTQKNRMTDIQTAQFTWLLTQERQIILSLSQRLGL